MCREIIGYKLKDQNLAKAASMIANGNPDGMKLVNEFNISIKAAGIEKLEKAGVLELWFEPIYEEEFKVGDWVCFDGEVVKSAPCRIKYIYEDGNGVGEDGTYKKLSCGKYRLATKQEIEQHLIAEAKRRGFEKGVRYNYPHLPHINERLCSGTFHLNDLNDLCDYSSVIYRNEDNAWAEIIKDEEIKISGYKAKFDKARKTVQFGCKTITLEELKAVLVVMELNKKFDYRFSISNNVICTIGECDRYGEIRNCVKKETIQKLIKILEDE